ncbi:FAD/NAD(P)-binding protein [Streptomyces griseus]|uniref:FAD/NAD(P)-binding protein n=1 Tax=Streptomyces griseus TaxID=1911 RepID=UPI000691842C|nr:FAD/NAD(P)-binding domain-containing protein [Streptomyces griseus]
MTALRVAVVGVGPRGLSVLQKIGELAGELPDGHTLDVHLIDPGEGGQGAHPARQPAHLLTNTVASQVSMFAEGSGPSFTEWAASVGYRAFDTTYHPTGDDSGAPVGEHAYLPRRLLGSYLSWVFDRTLRSLPDTVRVVQHRDRAVDVEPVGSDRYAVRLARGFTVTVDYLFLTTGHCERVPTEEDRAHGEFAREYADRNPHLAYFSTPYPVDLLQRIAPGSTVAVQGFGLTAHDVISELTAGRGGTFHGAGPDTEYRPSGREPRILLFSRQCLPFSARGVNQKGVTGGHPARFFTPEAVRALRRVRPDGRLDFVEDVLPLLVKEMGYAYREAQQGRPVPPEGYEPSEDERRIVGKLLDPLAGEEFADQAAFRRFFTDHVSNDLAHAERGNLTSPVKAATDVIRDTRAALREAVEFGGLTPASHRVFNTVYVPVMNRVSFGPPRHRNHQLLALLRAGVVDLAGGPGGRLVRDREQGRYTVRTDYPGGTEARHADALVVARLDAFHPERDRSPLTSALLARGLVRPYRNGDFAPGGLDIDERGRPFTAQGTPLRGAWAVGYLVEGPRFYTHALPRHGIASQFIRDADAAVRDMVTDAHRRPRTAGASTLTHTYDSAREAEHAGTDRTSVSVP